MAKLIYVLNMSRRLRRGTSGFDWSQPDDEVFRSSPSRPRAGTYL